MPRKNNCWQGGSRFDMFKEPSGGQCRWRQVRKGMSGKGGDRDHSLGVGRVSYFIVGFMENYWRDWSGERIWLMLNKIIMAV